MLRRLLFGGGVAFKEQELSMHSLYSSGYVGYFNHSGSSTSLTPNYITYRSKQYIIKRFADNRKPTSTELEFIENPPFTSVTIQVDAGNPFTLTWEPTLKYYKVIGIRNFSAGADHKIKILSVS